MKKFIVFGVIVLGVILYFVYHNLGGFKKPEISTVNSLSYNIVGKAFEGRYKDDALEEIFNEVKGKIESGELQGTLAIVTYKEPSEHKGELSNFTGVIVDNIPAELPEGYELRTIEAPKAVKAHMEGHILVMPPAEVITEQMKEYADSTGLKLQDISIDKYIAEGVLEIVIPAE